VPIFVFLGLSVLKLGLMYATDRRQTDRGQTKASLNASARKAVWQQISEVLVQLVIIQASSTDPF